MKLIRVQRKRTKGWKAPDNTVNVTRPGRYGNPFKVNERVPSEWVDKLDPADHFRYMKFECGYVDSAESAVYLFERYVLPTLDVSELTGKNIMCWCALDKPCHGDPILKKANQ